MQQLRFVPVGGRVLGRRGLARGRVEEGLELWDRRAAVYQIPRHLPVPVLVGGGDIEIAVGVVEVFSGDRRH